MLNFEIVAALQLALLAFSGYWLLARNDELPILANAFIFYVSSFRYWSVANGLTDWVNVTNLGFEPVTAEKAEMALNFIFLGQCFFSLAYFGTQNQSIQKREFKIPLLFADWLRNRIVILGLVVLPVVPATRAFMRAQFDAGISATSGMSAYIYLSPLLLISVATLLVILWRFGGTRTSGQKFVSVVMMAAVFYVTWNPTSRYQFLGWMLACMIVITAGVGGAKKGWFLGVFGVIILVTFAAAGSLRTLKEEAVISGEVDFNFKASTLDRALHAEDANMLDGFVLLDQVFPELLPWTLGGEHLAILYRPIPRVIWPNKPVAGYMNRLGAYSRESSGTLGISPTIFGDFYQEGSIFGIIILSMVWGYGAGRIIRFSNRAAPFPGVLTRAVTIAALLPLLRGGDLGGIVAWIGMGFWPCFLLLWKMRNPDFVSRFEMQDSALPVQSRGRGTRSRSRSTPRPAAATAPAPAPAKPMRPGSDTVPQVPSQPARPPRRSGRSGFGRHAPRWGR